VLSQFERLVIFLFENIKARHVAFSQSENLRMLIKRRMVSSEWGRRRDHSPFAVGRKTGQDEARLRRRRLGRSAAERPDCPLPREQGLENAQNGKGQLLAEVGMDLGSAPLSLGVSAAFMGGSICMPLV